MAKTAARNAGRFIAIDSGQDVPPNSGEAMNEPKTARPIWLDQAISFPHPELADAHGLVAAGGDLSVARLLAAYRQGIFPWTAKPITWWSPDPRGIIELDRFHISASLAKTLRRRPFEITFDRAFQEVMQACAAPAPGREATWITEEFIAAYTRLHQQGYAHSVECWREGQMVGGVYGVAVGGVFAGESMFHRADNASKVALHQLVEHLRMKEFGLFDIQMVTPATRSLGATEISRREYLARLAVAITQTCVF
jgi:leucyl/phenylalanyl-tRNA--protein transferase